MRWLWRAIRWLIGFVVFVFLVLGILLALLALFEPQEARHVVAATTEHLSAVLHQKRQ